MTEDTFGDLAEIVAPKHTAVVVIDVQNDFCDPAGLWGRHGRDLDMIQAMLPVLKRFLSQCREIGLPLVFTREIQDAEHTSGPMRSRWQRLDVREEYLQEGTWGAEICRGFEPQEADFCIVKYRYSGFSSETFTEWLKSKRIRTLVLTGVCTNVCVEATALDAYMRDYYAVVMEDCVAAFSPQEHEASLHDVRKYMGIVTSSEALLKLWSRRGA